MHSKSCAKATSRKQMSVADVIHLVTTDASFPFHRRASTLSSLRKLAKWKEVADASLPCNSDKAEDLPFTPKAINALFERLVPRVLGRSRKRIQNAHGDCKFVLQRYGLTARRLRVDLTPALRALHDKLGKFERIAIQKLFAYLSLHGLAPVSMSDTVAEQFFLWLRRHEFKNLDTIWRRALVTWNHAAALHADWPQIELSVPSKRDIWGVPWSAFPALEIKVDDFFAKGSEYKP